MIIYSEGMPSAPGVYACRVIRQRGGEIASDFFLFWNDVERKWHYLQQNRQFRGQVIVWLGPLPRVQLKHAKALAEYRRLHKESCFLRLSLQIDRLPIQCSEYHRQ